MTITAQRFKFLDQETNVPSIKFSSTLDSAILNAAAAPAIENITILQELINRDVKDTLTELEKAKTSFESNDVLSSVMRFTKEIGSSLRDLASLPDKVLGEYVGNIFPDGEHSKMIKNIIQRCQTRGSGYGIPGRPYDASVNCGAGGISVGTGSYGGYNNSSCNVSSFGNLLNKLSGGSYQSGFSDLSKALQSLMSLAGLGYNMNLCGVFGAIGQGLPSDALSKASGSLMTTFGLAGKTNAVLDIAGSSVGLTPTLSSPGVIPTFLKNYTNPSNVRERDYSGMSDRVMAGLELIDEDWNHSESDGLLSIAQAPGLQTDLKNIVKSSLTKKAFSVSSLDTIPDSDDDFLFGSYAMKTAETTLSNWF